MESGTKAAETPAKANQAGNLAIEYRGTALRWEEIPAPVYPLNPRPARHAASRKKTWTPPKTHPWNQAARRGFERKERQKAIGETPFWSSALP